jgi:hypothetical protein
MSTQSKSVFIFPVNTQTNRYGDITTQAAVLRLLQEVKYWMLRSARRTRLLRGAR